MEHLDRRETLVDLSHEPLHEDHLGKAYGQVPQVARKRIQVVEVVQLHGVRKVQNQILQVRTAIGDLVEYGRSDQLCGQLEVLQGTSESNADDAHEGIGTHDVQTAVLRT